MTGHPPSPVHAVTHRLIQVPALCTHTGNEYGKFWADLPHRGQLVRRSRSNHHAEIALGGALVGCAGRGADRPGLGEVTHAADRQILQVGGASVGAPTPNESAPFRVLEPRLDGVHSAPTD